MVRSRTGSSAIAAYSHPASAWASIPWAGPALLRYAREMHELAPGLWHWSARHEHIGADVSSYYLLAERVLIDSMLPPGGGLQWLEEHGPPAPGLVTNSHHHPAASRIPGPVVSPADC